ncbi:MAG: hypothetical protein H6551_11250 [Chitinophagales bacterium]|nr:hypothetical protein [Chitinophagaceae bacterium]MCB9065702.1 hypothetical protein [Chitinophagales bacterium]
MRHLLLVAILMIATVASANKFGTKLSSGWSVAGDMPDKYEMSSDDNGVCHIQSTAKRIKGFGTLMRTAVVEKYNGQRVRMTGYMRSENVDGWASFWFRVDPKADNDNKGNSTAFDNMYYRSIKGTTEWKEYEIVLDVDENTANIAFGALLNGTGEIWFKDVHFETVTNDVPVTDMKVAKNDNGVEFND